MSPVPHRLELYRDMATQAAAALAAAKDSAWETLARHEGRIAALRDLLNALPDPPLPSPDEARETQHLIEITLSRLEETRQHIQPHLDDLRNLLGDASARRRVDAAYGSCDTP